LIPTTPANSDIYW